MVTVGTVPAKIDGLAASVSVIIPAAVVSVTFPVAKIDI